MPRLHATCPLGFWRGNAGVLVLFRQQFTINGVKSYNSNGFRGHAGWQEGWLACCCCHFKRAISRRNLIGKITIKYETSETGQFKGGRGWRETTGCLRKQSQNKCRQEPPSDKDTREVCQSRCRGAYVNICIKGDTISPEKQQPEESKICETD